MDRERVAAEDRALIAELAEVWPAVVSYANESRGEKSASVINARTRAANIACALTGVGLGEPARAARLSAGLGFGEREALVLDAISADPAVFLEEFWWPSRRLFTMETLVRLCCLTIDSHRRTASNYTIDILETMFAAPGCGERVAALGAAPLKLVVNYTLSALSHLHPLEWAMDTFQALGLPSSYYAEHALECLTDADTLRKACLTRRAMYWTLCVWFNKMLGSLAADVFDRAIDLVTYPHDVYALSCFAALASVGARRRLVLARAREYGWGDYTEASSADVTQRLEQIYDRYQVPDAQRTPLGVPGNTWILTAAEYTIYFSAVMYVAAADRELVV